MIWRIPFDETKDKIEVTGGYRTLLLAAMSLSGVAGAVGMWAALFAAQSMLWASAGIAGLSLMCGFAWMIGLKARALNTLIVCCVLLGMAWVFG